MAQAVPFITAASAIFSAVGALQQGRVAPFDESAHHHLGHERGQVRRVHVAP